MKCQQNLVRCEIFTTKLTMSINVCYEFWKSVFPFYALVIGSGGSPGSDLTATAKRMTLSYQK